MGKLLKIIAIIALSVRAYSAETEKSRFEAKKFDPLREHSIIVTEGGYFPKTISLFKGETLKIYLTASDVDQSCLMLPSHEIFLSANKGRVTSAEATFEEPGEYSFFCPNNNIRGMVTVLERKKKKPKIERSPATYTKKEWMPKEL